MQSKLIFILLLVGLVQAQPSHRSMSIELLKEFQQFVADSSALPKADQILVFSGEVEVASYYNKIVNRLRETTVSSKGDTVYVELLSTSLSIDKDSSKTLRNTQYTRQLKLDVNYARDGSVITWRGNISDRITKKEVNPLLKEWYPVPISGNYRMAQPSAFAVISTTLGVLALVSTLFFIRT